jgi:hypothetical protein
MFDDTKRLSYEEVRHQRQHLVGRHAFSNSHSGLYQHEGAMRWGALDVCMIHGTFRNNPSIVGGRKAEIMLRCSLSINREKK